MPNEILQKNGSQLLFADHATDFGAAPATAANSLVIGAPNDIQIDLTGVSTGRASAKADLGTPWASKWAVDACLEFETAPAEGGYVEFRWAASPSATAGTGNPAGLTGADEAFTESEGKLGQMQRIGSLLVQNNVINIGRVGVLIPQFQYGMLVIINRASTALRSTATAMDETHITMTELITEVQ